MDYTTLLQSDPKPELVTGIGLFEDRGKTNGVIRFARSGPDAHQHPYGFWLSDIVERPLKIDWVMEESLARDGSDLSSMAQVENKGGITGGEGLTASGYVIGGACESLGRVDVRIKHDAGWLFARIHVSDGMGREEQRDRAIRMSNTNDGSVVDAIAQVIGEGVSLNEEVKESWGEEGVMIGAGLRAINDAGNKQGWGSATGKLIRVLRSLGNEGTGTRPVRIDGTGLLSF
ncbi:MAG: hypothetical protein RJQ08_11680 [Salinisphaeraceae bacterium]